MKKHLLFCLFCIAFFGNVWAQQTEAASAQEVKLPDYRNIVYFEVLGNSNFGISANYARHMPLKTKQQITFSIRAGIGKVFTLDMGKPSDQSYLAFPLEISVFTGRSLIKPEFGVGLTFIDDVASYPVGFSQERTKKVLLTSFGIRLQQPGDRFFMKGGITCGLVDLNVESPDLAVWTLWTNRILPGILMGVRF